MITTLIKYLLIDVCINTVFSRIENTLGLLDAVRSKYVVGQTYNEIHVAYPDYEYAGIIVKRTAIYRKCKIIKFTGSDYMRFFTEELCLVSEFPSIESCAKYIAFVHWNAPNKKISRVTDKTIFETRRIHAETDVSLKSIIYHQ